MQWTRDLEEAVTRVADHTAERDMESEDWQKAVALNGLLALGDEAYDAAARRYVDRSVETQTSAGQLSYGSLDPRNGPEYAKEWHTHHRGTSHHVNPVALGLSVLEFYERTGEERYLDAARKQYEYLCDVETVDGAIPQHQGGELWLDSVYMCTPFLARYGAVADEQDALDRATTQVTAIADRLQDEETGLFRHTWKQQPSHFPQSTFWSRGNGWVMAGIVEALEHLPDDHPDRDALVDVFRTAASGLLDLQDASGYWHNTLDDPLTALEVSGTCMFAYAFAEAHDRGILDDDAYVTAAQSGVDVCTGVVDENGEVRRVAVPPGGPNAPLGVTSYGQGFFLLAASQFLE